MKLTKAGQLVNIETREVENILDFDHGTFTLVITDSQYQQVLTFLQGAPKKEPFYIDEEKVLEEDGVSQI